MKRLDGQDKLTESVRRQSLGPLLPLLQEEGALLETTLTLVGQERRAIRMRDLAKLEKTIAAKKDALKRLYAVEQQRKELLANWGLQNGLQGTDLTISGLLDLASEDGRAFLAHAYERLAGLVEAVSQANKVNAALLVRLLSNVQQSLSLVVSLQSGDVAYTATGSTITTSRRPKRLIERCV